MKYLVGKSLFVLLLLVNVAIAGDQLPSWNEGGVKKAIIAFVETIRSPHRCQARMGI